MGGDTQAADTGADVDEDTAPDGADDTALADADDTTTADTAPEDMTTGDTTTVWTGRVRFSIVFLDAALNEIVHMVGAGAIEIPNVKIRAEDPNTFNPLVGQTIAVSSDLPATNIQPRQSVTDAEGLTEVLTLSLSEDMSGGETRHTFIPYIVPNQPNPLDTLDVRTHGLVVELLRPTDANGDPVDPVADASTYTMTLSVSRFDPTNTVPLPDNIEVGIELITNTGEPPMRFSGEPTVDEKRWPLDPSDPNVTVDFDTGTEPGSLRLFLKLWQLDGPRGSELMTIEVQ